MLVISCQPAGHAAVLGFISFISDLAGLALVDMDELYESCVAIFQASRTQIGESVHVAGCFHCFEFVLPVLPGLRLIVSFLQDVS